MAAYEDDPRRERSVPEASSWAVTGFTFAALALFLIGAFQAIMGLTAVFNDDFFVVTRNYTFDVDVSVWGWIHLLLGVIMVATAVGLVTGKTWALTAGIVLAMISAIANFFFIPYYPLWAIGVIVFDLWVIWSLTRPGVIDA